MLFSSHSHIMSLSLPVTAFHVSRCNNSHHLATVCIQNWLPFEQGTDTKLKMDPLLPACTDEFCSTPGTCTPFGKHCIIAACFSTAWGKVFWVFKRAAAGERKDFKKGADRSFRSFSFPPSPAGFSCGSLLTERSNMSTYNPHNQTK